MCVYIYIYAKYSKIQPKLIYSKNYNNSSMYIINLRERREEDGEEEVRVREGMGMRMRGPWEFQYLISFCFFS